MSAVRLVSSAPIMPSSYAAGLRALPQAAMAFSTGLKCSHRLAASVSVTVTTRPPREPHTSSPLEGRAALFAKLDECTGYNELRALHEELRPLQSKSEFKRMLRAHFRADREVDAISLVDDMLRAGIQPDRYTFQRFFISALKSNTKITWKHVFPLYEIMRDVGIVPNYSTSCSVLAACAEGGQARHALSVLDDMRASKRKKRMLLDRRPFSLVLKACERAGGHWDEMLRLLDEMRERGIDVETNEWMTKRQDWMRHSRRYAKKLRRKAGVEVSVG